MQVLLVTGGEDYTYLSSTELLLPSASSWRYSADLPSSRRGLRAATLNNKVVVTGTNMDTLIKECHIKNIYYSLLYTTQCRGA